MTDLVTISEHIAQEWGFISSTPATQATLLCIMSTIFYFAFKKLTARQMNNYKSQIDLFEKRISLYSEMVKMLEIKSKGIHMPDIERDFENLKQRLKVLEEQQPSPSRIEEVVSGSNSNGRFVRYSDGTQSVYGSINYVIGPFEKTLSVVFPASFISPPIINLTPEGKLLIQSKTDGQFTVSESEKTGSQFTVEYMASGRWK